MAPHYRIIRKINWKNTVKDLAHCLAPQQNSILLVIIIVVTSCLGAGPWNPSPQPLPAGEQTPRRLVPLLSPSSAGPFPPRLPRPAPPRPVPPLSSEETFRRLVHRPVSGPRCRGLGAERDGRLRVCAADAGAGARPQGNGELTVSEPGPAGWWVPGAGGMREGGGLPFPELAQGGRKAPASLQHPATGRRNPTSFGDLTRGLSLLRPTS